ncbi:MAG: hypothetical protein HUU50_00165 [Candidatus Brocadiae bacterium]|nr:hypothetical protein [Candidatus Brocadiia bacterium]
MEIPSLPSLKNGVPFRKEDIDIYEMYYELNQRLIAKIFLKGDYGLVAFYETPCQYSLQESNGKLELKLHSCLAGMSQNGTYFLIPESSWCQPLSLIEYKNRETLLISVKKVYQKKEELYNFHDEIPYCHPAYSLQAIDLEMALGSSIRDELILGKIDYTSYGWREDRSYLPACLQIEGHKNVLEKWQQLYNSIYQIWYQSYQRLEDVSVASYLKILYYTFQEDILTISQEATKHSSLFLLRWLINKMKRLGMELYIHRLNAELPELCYPKKREGTGLDSFYKIFPAGWEKDLSFLISKNLGEYLQKIQEFYDLWQKTLSEHKTVEKATKSILELSDHTLWEYLPDKDCLFESYGENRYVLSIEGVFEEKEHLVLLPLKNFKETKMIFFTKKIAGDELLILRGRCALNPKDFKQDSNLPEDIYINAFLSPTNFLGIYSANHLDSKLPIKIRIAKKIK